MKYLVLLFPFVVGCAGVVIDPLPCPAPADASPAVDAAPEAAPVEDAGPDAPADVSIDVPVPTVCRDLGQSCVFIAGVPPAYYTCCPGLYCDTAKTCRVPGTP